MVFATKTVGEAMPVYDAVVIGSGYGGGVAASRLARMGLRLAVLEQGRLWRPGDFPTTAKARRKTIRLTGRAPKLGDPAGLYYLSVGKGLTVFGASGLGGGSLINAGVVLRPDLGRLRKAGWPDAVVSDGLLLEGTRAGGGNARCRAGARSGALCQVCRHAQGGGSVGPFGAVAADDDLPQSGTERCRRDAVRLPALRGLLVGLQRGRKEHRRDHIHRRCGRSWRNGVLRKPGPVDLQDRERVGDRGAGSVEGERKPAHRGADRRPGGRHIGDQRAALAGAAAWSRALGEAG